MNFNFKPFQDFVFTNTTEKTRSRYDDSLVQNIHIENGEISSTVIGTSFYKVFVKFTTIKVTEASCDCPYNKGGYCKHIVNVLVEADGILNRTKSNSQAEFLPSPPQRVIELIKEENNFFLPDFTINQIDKEVIKALKMPGRVNSRREITQGIIEFNHLVAEVRDGFYNEYVTEIHKEPNGLRLRCECDNDSDKICKHLSYLLERVNTEPYLNYFIDETALHKVYQEAVTKWGLGEVENPEELFKLEFFYGRLTLKKKIQLLPLAKQDKERLKGELLVPFQFPQQEVKTMTSRFLVLKKTEYDNRINITLMEAPMAQSGKLKSPVEAVSLHQEMGKTENKDELLFYSGLIQQNDYSENKSNFLYHIVKNPLNLPIYLLKDEYGKITPKKLIPVSLSATHLDLKIDVEESNQFYILSCKANFENHSLNAKSLKVYGDFLHYKDNFYYLKNETEKKVLSFFTERGNKIYIHDSQFDTFKKEFLDSLEESVNVHYSFLKKAPKKLIKQEKLDEISAHIIYLSEQEDYVLITPVVRYGEIEVPILSKKTVYTTAPDGKLYAIERNKRTEERFLRVLQTQHPSFAELPLAHFFYLHKQEFLDDGWFLEAFEEWELNNYEILGFSQLKNNNYNAHKMKVQMKVKSGIDWFDIETKVSFGGEQVELRQIQKSILNKSRFVKLGDGSKGILPEEWINKFGNYFRSAEIKDDFLRTHKSNFQLIDDLFEKEVMDEELRIELENYREKLNNFHSIRNIKPPKKLKGTLRDYQKEGLNWLNFLDEFNFGGCLADDMGLGKTVQIIAYILSQHEKGNKATNLIVVPTSLLFNWQKELDKFAPHLKYLVLYGTNRETKKTVITKNDVVITTYGTMLSDVEKLRKIEFNLIVLDESQAIKNPTTQRYKAVRLLQGRQRIVVTGTPVENNTFDLYSQLSFAMPGLFGSAQKFQADYSTPIDKFQDTQRAKELQKRVNPFILRRTKRQVASELPEKTEMVIYCEMPVEQRHVYDSYKAEFQEFLSNKSDEEMKQNSLHVLQGLTKLRQICNSPALLSDDEFYGDESAKLEELMTQILKLKDHHKILIFSQFVKMLDLIRPKLEKENIGYAYLTGQTRKREEEVEKFQKDEDIRVFLISLKAGGTGLNLTEAEYVFIVDPWWNPAVENQAIDRAHRIGQQNKVVAIRLITPDSIEEKIIELQNRKKQLVEDLIHVDKGGFKSLTKDDLMGLL